jgi:hypothetical protein
VRVASSPHELGAGERAAALGEIAEQSSENAAFPVGLNADLDRLLGVERTQDGVQAGERQVDLADLEQQNVAQGLLLNRRPALLLPAAPVVALPDREAERLPRHARRAADAHGPSSPLTARAMMSVAPPGAIR